MIQTMKSQNLLQKSDMSQTVKQQKRNTREAILLSLKQKLLNKVFVIIPIHFFLVTGNITVAADNDTDVAFKNCTPFSTCTTKINDIFADESNHIYIAMPMYNLLNIAIIIQIRQEVYGNLKR